MVIVSDSTLLDFVLPFTIERDASEVGPGVVLSHNTKPVTYYSQKLAPGAQMKLVYERKL